MSSSSSDLTVRTERLRALTLGRTAIATGLLGGLSTVGRGLVDADLWPLLTTVAVVYGVVQLLAIALPRHRPATARPLTEVALLVDVAALAVVLAATGGTHSPLSVLLLTQVVAVTLLFGRWAGLRASLLGSVAIVWLLPTTPLLGSATAVGAADPALAAAADPTIRAALLLVALWATTLVTGWLSTVTERELRGRTEDLTLLREITPDLDPRQGPERVAQAITEVVVDRLGHAAAGLWLPRAGGPSGDGGEGDEALTLTGRHGTRIHPSLQDLDTRLHGDHVMLDGDGQPTIRPLGPTAPHPAPLDTVFGPNAPLLIAPLVVEERPVGLLVIEVRTRVRRTAVVRPRQLRLLRMLTEQASLLLDNARLQSELADQATRDAVTGLPNHRYFQQRLGEELERVARRAERGEHRSVSLALLDLDRFKAVNDTYGHPTGDRVLAAVSAAASESLRDSDVVCRYGGEEFAIVLVDSDAQAARVAVERVRDTIRALRLEAVDGRALAPVTASVGIETVVGRREPRAAVIERADLALYAAKRTGRDRALHHDDLPVVDLDDVPHRPEPATPELVHHTPSPDRGAPRAEDPDTEPGSSARSGARHERR